MASTFHILRSHSIDAEKWNACVINADNGLIYSRYEYLNGICDNWDGIVIDDYKAVMALPWRKKIGIKYLYEPAFIQQLGLIGATNEDVLDKVFEFANYGDVLLNFSNGDIANKVGATHRVNLVIDLSFGYDSISSNYKKDLQQNLKKAQQGEMIMSGETDIKTAFASYKEYYNERFQHISAQDFERAERLCLALSSKGMCFTRKLTNANGELLSIGLFLKDEKRIYNVMNTTTDAGRKSEANHYLIDAVIKEFAQQKLVFDFEGSDLPGVKSFYEKFGAVNQPYFHYHFNKLPFPLRLLKR
jgi:hypothetical protein